MIGKKEGELKQTAGEIKVNDIVIESPWKKLFFFCVIIILVVVVMEFGGIFLEDKEIPFLQTTYFPYFCICVVGVVVFALVVWFIIKKRKSEKGKNGGVEKNIVKKVVDKDTKRILGVVDSLLEKLPQNEIVKFAKSKDAKLYKAVLKKHGVK
ncbi:MAG: hypothetical protein ABIH59_02570 [archaeon]